MDMSKVEFENLTNKKISPCRNRDHDGAIKNLIKKIFI